MAVLITAEMQGFSSTLKNAQGQLAGFESSILKANKLLSSFGVGFGLYQVTQVVGDAINTLAGFERQMSTVKAITGATSKEFDGLRESAIKLGSSTQFTAKEVAELQVEFGRIGFSVKEIQDATKATIQLATATGEDLAKSADVAGSTIRGFNLNANQTGRVVDVMAEAFNATALGLDNFSEAMKYVAPIANVAGASIEETTALLGVLADAGIRGSQAGTSLRKIFTDVAKDGRPLLERLKELAAAGLNQAGAMDEVGRTAYASLLVLIENIDKTEKLTKQLNNAAGASDKAAKIIGDNLVGDLKKLSSTYDALILSGSSFIGFIRDVVQSGTAFLGFLSEANKKATSFGLIMQANLAPARAFFQLLKFSFSDTPLDDKQIQSTLKKLNQIRDNAKLSGNREEEVLATKFIAALTTRYQLLKPAIEEVAAAEDKDKDKKAEQIGIIQALEDKLKDYEEKKKAAFSTAEITAFNDKIKDVRDQLDILNQTSLSGATSNIPTGAKAVQKTGADFLGDTGQADDPVSKMVAGFQAIQVEAPKAVDAMDEVKKAFTASGEEAQAQAAASNILFDQQIEKQQQLAAMAQQAGNIIIDGISGVISGQRTLLQAVRQITKQLIELFLKQALAGTIAGAGNTAAPPPVIVALAAAGVAAVSALFSSAVGGTASSAGAAYGGRAVTQASTYSPGSRQQQDIAVTGRIVVNGREMAVVLDNYNNKTGRTG